MRSLIPVLAAALVLGLAMARTYPLIRHFGTHVAGDLVDPLFNAWVLAWDVRALARGLRGFFDANIGFPVELSLAFSDHLLGVLPIAGPVLLLTGNPVAAYNALFLSSFALAGLSAFCLARYWTGAFWPSLVAGVLYGLAPWRFSQISHLQLLGFFWAPLVLLFLDRTLRDRRWRDLWLFALFWWLQVLASSYLAYMVTVAVALHAGHYVLAVDRTWLSRAMLPRALALTAASAVVLLPVHLPYAVVAHRWDATRTLGSVVGFSADLASFAAPPGLMNGAYRWMAAPILAHANHETLLFPGLVTVALVVLGSRGRAGARAAADARRLQVASWIVVGTALVLVLGPWLTVLGRRTSIPLPYLIPYHVVPGWDAMRAPARFMALALLGAIPLVALGAARLGAITRRPALTALGLIALFLVELGAEPLPLAAAPTPSAVHRWLADHRPGPVVELPHGTEANSRWQYLSAAHWMPLVNGRSGFWPRAQEDLQNTLASLPGAAARRTAAALGVAAVVVHEEELTADQRARWSAAEQAGLVRKLAAFDRDVVYQMPPAPGAFTSQLRADLDAPAWLPPDRTVRVGLIVHGDAGQGWRHPAPQGLAHVGVEWVPRGGGSTVSAKARAALPFALAAAESAAVPIRVTAPSAPGAYRLRVALPDHGLATEAPAIEVREAPLPTSAQGPRLLAAAFGPFAGTIACKPFGAFLLPVEVRNTGAALWLSRATHNRGEVRFAWRFVPAAGAPGLVHDGGRIRYDVLPGQTYRTELSVDAPGTPGRYALEVGLIADGVTSFAEVGTPPARLPVEVRRGD